ncbi:hypothetical protein CIHG_04929 [Coccidioides immitis H538.4]|uniref:Pre-mRNA splicing factor n=1 Tax=Coccidioides immitis H538.4 TaxID=396776 RepID=A0A0J8RSR1_COCIT|nr:hypothetical protein CIHG_04929 [Coccidioides immitis H538.4]
MWRKTPVGWDWHNGRAGDGWTCILVHVTHSSKSSSAPPDALFFSTPQESFLQKVYSRPGAVIRAPKPPLKTIPPTVVHEDCVPPTTDLQGPHHLAAILDFHLVPGEGRRNYTGFVTKTILYSATLLVFLTASALTLASIIVPKWVSYYSETPSGMKFHYSYGLHRRCSSLTQSCDPFPQYEDCHGDNDGSFCSMWRSVAFLMSFAIVLEGMTLITYIFILAGGKQMRETGWKVLTLFLVFITLVQCAAMALVSYLFDNDERFYPGWKLDKSWIMSVVSMCLAGFNAVIIYMTIRTLPSEGGYELIADNS